MMAALLRIWLARNGTPRLAAYQGGLLTAAGGTRKWLRSHAPRGGCQRQEFVRSKNTWLKECRQRGTNDFQVLSTKAAHDATAKRHCFSSRATWGASWAGAPELSIAASALVTLSVRGNWA